jgi:hypothetical protein
MSRGSSKVGIEVHRFPESRRRTRRARIHHTEGPERLTPFRGIPRLSVRPYTRGGKAGRAERDAQARDRRAERQALRGEQARVAAAYAGFGGLEEKAALYLGRHRRVGAVVAYLLGKQWPLWGVLVALALDDAPDRLREFIHQGLWSRRPEDRLTAAAVLALRDDAWSRGELLALLAKKGGPDATVEARAALHLSRDPGAGGAADRWEGEHPEKGEPPPTSNRFWYVLHGGIAQALRDRMAELADRVPRAGAGRG